MNDTPLNQQQYPAQPVEQQPPATINGSKNKVAFGILFIFIVIILFLGILNYLNILPLSSLFPNQLGWLPHRTITSNKVEYMQPNKMSQKDVPSGTSQAKQTLTNFLPTILPQSLLPESMSNVTIKSNETGKESYIASWRPKEGVVRIRIQGLLGSRKFNSIDLFYDKEIIQSPSPTVVLAKSEINQIFSIRSEGTWGCKNFTDTTLYCENFWDESGDLRRGLGFLLISTKTKGRVIYSFCEHSKESNLYTWKSCRAEFAESGVK